MHTDARDIHELKDINELKAQINAAEGDAQALAAGLTEERGVWRAEDDSWSVAECLEHLTATNRVYLGAMKEPAERAREKKKFRRGPAAPGLVGRWFVKMMEPPVKTRFKMKAPRIIEPCAAPPLANALANFRSSQAEVRAFLNESADLDLAAVRFPNPFIRGIRFSVATGLHVVTAHERRHLWQAWRVRRAAEGAACAAFLIC